MNNHYEFLNSKSFDFKFKLLPTSVKPCRLYSCIHRFSICLKYFMIDLSFNIVESLHKSCWCNPSELYLETKRGI